MFILSTVLLVSLPLRSGIVFRHWGLIGYDYEHHVSTVSIMMIGIYETVSEGTTFFHIFGLIQ